MAKSAAQMAGNWKAAMASPQTAQKYKQGISGTTVNPMQLAAAPAAQQKYANATALAVSSGRMANRLNATSMETWKNNAMNVGANLLSSGATKAGPKMDAHFQKWAPVYQQASDAAKSIPHDGSDAAALARVAAAMGVLKRAAGK